MRPPPAFSYFLALRYLMARWVNLISVVGIGLSVWAMIAVVAVLSGFIGESRRGIREATPDLLLTALPADADFARLQPLLAGIEGVAHTAPRIHHHAMLLPQGGAALMANTKALQSGLSGVGKFVMLCGIDATLEEETTGYQGWFAGLSKAPPGQNFEVGSDYLPDDPAEPFAVAPAVIQSAARRLMSGMGESPPLDAQPGVMVGFARITGGDSLVRGQKLNLLSLHREVQDEKPVFRKIKIDTYLSAGFVSRHRLLNQTVCFIDIHELRNYFGADPLLGLGPEQLVTDVALRLQPAADPTAVAAAVTSAVRQAGLGAQAEVLDWSAQNATYLDAVELERSMMKLSLAAVMLVACFLIFVTLHMLVTQKTKDIGILTSMGATTGGITSLFLASGLIIGLVGAGSGLLGGYLTALFVNDIDVYQAQWTGRRFFPVEIYNLDALPVDMDPAWMLQVAGAALLLSLLVAWWPARKASRKDPVKALMHY